MTSHRTLDRTKITDAAFDALSDAVLIVDRSGVIVLNNRSAERMFGYARNELVGRSLEALVPPASRLHHGAYVARYFDAPRSRPMGTGLEITGMRSDNTEFPVEIALGPVHGSDGDLLVAATIHERTHSSTRGVLAEATVRDREVHAEAQIAEATRHVTKAQYDSAEYHRALRHYTQLVRHRLANPLQVILGMTRTLRDLPDVEPEIRREMLDAILSAATSLERDTLFEASIQSPEEGCLNPVPSVDQDPHDVD